MESPKSRVRRIFIELRLLDNGRHPKGIAFERVEGREDQARYGELVKATIMAVSGRHGRLPPVVA